MYGTKSTEAEILRDLSRLNYEKFENRRSIEWRVNFGVWTALAGFVALVATKDPKLSVGPVLAGLTAFVIVHAYWLYAMHTRHEFNKTCHHFLDNALLQRMGLRTAFEQAIAEKRRNIRRWIVGQYWSIVPTVSVSALLASLGAGLALKKERSANMQVLADIIASIVWPVTVLILACMFREPLLKLFGRLKETQLAGNLFKFAVDDVDPDAPRQPPDESAAFALVAKSPALAVAELWNQIAAEARRAAQKKGVDLGKNTDRVIIRNLQENQVVTPQQADVFRELRVLARLANRGGNSAIAPDDARKFVSIGLPLLKDLQSI